MSTELLLHSLQPYERSYYDDLKKLSLQDVERQLAALLVIRERFLGTARIESFQFTSSCIQLCQHVIAEHAANHGLALSDAMVKGLAIHARIESDLVCDAASLFASFMAIATCRFDPELEASIARHRANAAYGQHH